MGGKPPLAGKACATPCGAAVRTPGAGLPTGAVAGIGAKLLSGSYYSQTIDMWAALVAGSVVAALLVTLVGAAGRLVERGMGARPA